MQPSVITLWILPLALFIIMFGVGMTLRWSDFTRLLRAPKPVALGLICQLLLLPLLAFVLVKLFVLTPVAAVALMVLAFAPGGATSNMLSLLARGDTALSVTLTAITSMITPFTLPVLTLWMLSLWGLSSQALAFPVLPSIAKMVVVTLVPVMLGMFASHRWPGLAQRMRRPVKLMSLVFMLMVVGAIVAANMDRLGDIIRTAGPLVMILACGALLCGYLVARLAGLQQAQGITLALETGIQNAGTALMVTSGLLQNAEMSGVVLMYGVLMQAPALLLVAWRNRDLVGARLVQSS